MAYPNPSINGTDLPLAVLEGPMRAGEDDRSTYLAGRARSRRKGLLQLWLFWEWTFFGTAAQWASVRVRLEGDEAGEFDFSPRGADVFRSRCTSPLPNLTPLYSRTARGEPVFRVDVRVEAVGVAHVRPDVYDHAVIRTTFYTDDDAAAFTDDDGAALTDARTL